MNINSNQISKILAPCPISRADKWYSSINAAIAEYEINTPKRIAAFLAQIGHESGRLVYSRELWGPTAAQAKYEGRADLGDIQEGDGIKFKGRGLIQITGRANYQTCGQALGLDLLNYPELLEQPEAASRSAGWFWQTHGCNELADADDFERICQKINGGKLGKSNGREDRFAIWKLAKLTLGV